MFIGLVVALGVRTFFYLASGSFFILKMRVKLMVTYLEQIVFVRDYVALQLFILFMVYGGIAFLLSALLCKIATRFAHFSTTELDNKIIDTLKPAVQLTIMGIALIQSLSELDMKDGAAQIFTMICLTVILGCWLICLRKSASLVVDHFTVESQGVGQDFLFLVHKLFLIVLFVSGVFMILEIWHVNLTPLLASAGVAGIAIALAAKDTLSNFFGGISLFLDKIYKVGDYIIVDDRDRGEVVSLGIRSTRILTRDDVLVTVPNSILANSRIINETAPFPRYRIKIPVGVAYGTDLDHVEKVLLDVASRKDSILATPAPRVRVRSLANSSVDFELLVWVADPRDRGLQIHDFLKSVYVAFQEEGIAIPFPQLDVHLDQ